MPSPLDVPAIQGITADGHETPCERKSSDDEPFSALAFKIMNDPFVGECCVVCCCVSLFIHAGLSLSFRRSPVLLFYFISYHQVH